MRKTGTFICILSSLLIIGYLIYSISTDLKKTNKVVIQSDTIVIPGDSFPHEVQVYVPMPKDTIRDTCWRERAVDTLAILQAFFEQRIYNDTIRDSSMVAIIKETISENRIADRKIWMQNLRSQTIIYQTIDQPPNLMGGFMAGFNGTQFEFSGVGTYNRKNDAFIFSVGTNDFKLKNIYYKAGYMWKIK